MARARRDFRSRRQSRRAANPISGTSSADNVETDRREAGESELAGGGWRHIDDATARERPAIGNSHHHRSPIPPIGDAHDHQLMCGSSCKMTSSKELWISRWPWVRQGRVGPVLLEEPIDIWALARDDFSSNRHPALTSSWSMIFFRKPVSTFRDHALATNLPTLVGRRNFRPRDALYCCREHQTCFRQRAALAPRPRQAPLRQGCSFRTGAVQKRKR
jgi:hypothetical protein